MTYGVTAQLFALHLEDVISAVKLAEQNTGLYR